MSDETNPGHPLDEQIRAALRDVPAPDPQVRSAHLDAALAEFDQIHGDRGQGSSADAGDEPAAVVPLRRRRVRVLQVAAVVAVAAAAGGIAVALGGGGRTADRADRSAVAAHQPADRADVPKAAGDAAGRGASSSVAPTSRGEAAFSQDGSARSASGKEAPLGAVAGPTPPRVPAGPVPGSLGVFPDDDALRAEVAARAAAGTLPTGVDPDVACPAPATVSGPVTGTSATVAGHRRVVWVQRGHDGGVASVAVLDPSTCRPA
jgi:hypothetical protein